MLWTVSGGSVPDTGKQPEARSPATWQQGEEQPQKTQRRGEAEARRDLEGERRRRTYQ
jgi:hypothetical protein